MPLISMLFGVLLIALGVEGFTGTFNLIGVERLHQFTALIPALFGLGLLFCGFIALKPSSRKHAMHAAAAIGLIGFLAAASRGAPKMMPLFRGELAGNAAAAKATLIMSVLCLLYVLLGVNSFIRARRRRKAAEQSAVR